uniref:Acetylcholine receptor neuronal subunit alpha 9/10-like 103 n=2 Tax=Saccoglossus kowalevskii TaxID=10224 RepID=A0A0U2USF6_SACKO|nr:acetylcholine receptor neuronal subunit alpha 9/10-like 103 [Saccoglossus kowalevskii]
MFDGLILYLIAAFLVQFQGAFAGSEQKLFENIFRNYNNKVRPVWNWTHAVDVNLTMQITQIVDMDERNQILTTNVWIEQHWIDEKLVWKPEEYDGILILRIPAKEMWVPDITLYDNADAHDYAESIKASNCLVQHNGWVSLWSRPTVLKSTCKIDVKYFPFDKQQCRLKFGSWTYNGEQINLNQHAVKPDLTNLVPNEQWDLLYAITTRHSMRYECCPDTYHDVTFLVGLERKPLYYIYNLIMPCVLLSALSLLGFFMPYDVGVVKVSLSVTLILSLTVFLLLVAEMMPRTSDEIPLIGQYYAATMFLISISTAMNVAVLNVNERGALGVFEVPRWIRIVVLKYMATLVFMSDCSKSRMIKTASLDRTQGNSSVNSKYYVQRDCSGNSTGSMNNRHCRMPMGTGYNEQDMLLEDRSDHTTLDGCSDRRLHRLEKTVDLILRHLKTAQRRKEKYTIVRQEWALVATVLDRVLLTMFVLCTGITTLTLLLQRQGPLIPFDPFDEYAVFDLEQYQPNIAYDT